MKYLKIVVITVLVFGLFLTTNHFSKDLYIQQEIEAIEVNAKIGHVAPDFLLKGTDGEIYSLSTYLGKKVVINFWAVWCPTCKAEMPDFQNFYEKKQDNIVFLSINSDPDMSFDTFLKENNITFPVLLDKNNKIANKYRVIAVPTTFFIDEYGKITNIHYGPLTVEMLNKLISLN